MTTSSILSVLAVVLTFGAILCSYYAGKYKDAESDAVSKERHNELKGDNDSLKTQVGELTSLLVKRDNEVAELKRKTAMLTKYANVSKIDWVGLGNGTTVHPDIIAAHKQIAYTDLYEKLRGCYDLISDERYTLGDYQFKLDESTLPVYRKIIEEHPDYPFTYVYMGLALKDLQKDGWRDYLETAIKIFEYTTNHPECNSSQRVTAGEVLKILDGKESKMSKGRIVRSELYPSKTAPAKEK